MKRTSNPCVATCADGSKCGRRAPLGEQLCHIHKNGPPGKLFQAKTRTPEEIVRKLMDDSDPTIRRQGVELWMKHFEQRKSDTGRGYAELVRLLTADEREELSFHLACVAAIKEKVYDRNPDLDADHATLERRRKREVDAMPSVAVTVSKAAALPQPAPTVTVDDEPAPEPEPVITYPRPATKADADRIEREHGWDITAITEYEPGQFRFKQKD